MAEPQETTRFEIDKSQDEEDGSHGSEGGMLGNSLIEEVRLTVPVGDDPSLPVWTLRMWLLGLLSCSILAFINQFFYYREAPLTISAITAQIITLYLGRFLAAVLPKHPLLNPGPFNMKEHVLIYIFANAGTAFGSSSAYAVDIVTLTNNAAFYNSYMSFAAAILIVITTQVLGYGWSGLLRRYLVDPGAMWWPSNLINVSLFHTMHEEDKPEPGQMKRYNFFLLVTIISFLYYAFPGYLFTALSSFAWVCWIWPNSIVAQQIGSGYSGMGIGALSFDWATAVSYNGVPLATPWWALVNIFLGFALMMFVAQPFLYWYNVYDARNFEFFGSNLFMSDGALYDISMVIDQATLTLNETAYQEYGPPHISVFFAFTYGISFAALTAVVVHVALWNGKEIYKQTMAAVSEETQDVHTRIMKTNYAEVPEWWFMVLGVVTIAVSIITVTVWNNVLQLPWWGVLLAVMLSGGMTLPIGIIAATTNQVPGLNVITELIMGFILPGKPIANVLFKTYGYISMTQAVMFLADFKLGTYMKVPPRSMFAVQTLGTIIAAIVNLGTAWWQLTSIENICNVSELPEGSPWTCPYSHVFFDASVIWGLIGPERIFGSEGEYWAMNWFWLVGALAPIPFWLLYKYWPRKMKWAKLVNMPILLGASGIAPPAATINFTSWFAWGFFFQFYLFRYHKAFWARYNYLFAAAMETGIAFMAIILFIPQNYGKYIDWWGNNPECPIATCPTQYDASLAFGDPCPVWNN